MSASIFRSIARQVCLAHAQPTPHSSPHQTPRSSIARSVRFASTGKQQTLKERLAELIPVELENVDPLLLRVLPPILTFR